jgi:hypothetical protein
MQLVFYVCDLPKSKNLIDSSLSKHIELHITLLNAIKIMNDSIWYMYNLYCLTHPPLKGLGFVTGISLAVTVVCCDRSQNSCVLSAENTNKRRKQSEKRR